jgi:transposase-like protein
MSEHRRKFSPQFKAEAVQMVIETGKPVAEVARDLGVMTGRWGTGWQRGAMLTLSRRRLSHRSSVPA